MMDKKKKRLLVTASTFPRWEGDTEPRFVLDLSKHMTDEFDVTVLAPAAPGAKEQEILEGVNVIRYHYFPVHKWETLCYPGAIVPRIKEKKIRILLVPFLFVSLYIHLFKILPDYDVVHAHWLIPQGIVQSFFKTPYIVTGHGGDISSMNGGIVGKLKKKCLKKAKAVIVVSEYKQRELKEKFPFVRSSIISMGANIDNFNKKKNYVSNYWRQGSNKIILYVGRLAEIKGVSYLLEAMDYIENAKLIIVGDGPDKDKLKNTSKKYADKCEFVGSKPHKELSKIYASADVLVVPSIIDEKGAQEGLPTVIFEAMASELPVVATRTGGIPDLIIDRKNGLLCEQKNIIQIAECIREILNDKELRNRIISEGLKTVENYDYKNIARRYKKILDGIQKIRGVLDEQDT